MLESKIEGYFKKKFESAGGMFLKFTSAIAGVPDRVAILGGKVWFIELKSEGKKPRPLQQRVIAKMQKVGVNVIIIDSKTGVDTFLQECIIETKLNRRE